MYISKLKQRVQYSRDPETVGILQGVKLWTFIFDWYKIGHHTYVKEMWAADSSGIEVTKVGFPYVPV